MDRRDIEKRVGQWEAEGYDVSELKAKWFSTRKGTGPKRLLIALVVVAILVTVLVSTRPQASPHASPTAGDAPLTVQFYDRSAGIVTSRAWDFGDGSTSQTRNPSHTYTREGTYTVRLTVTGFIGSDTRTLSSPIVVARQASYNLVISSTAGGTVTTPGEGTFPYDAGTRVTLTASQASGNVFSHWSGDASGTSPTTTLTMNSNKGVTAHFIRQYTLTMAVSPSGGGTTSPAVGSRTYDDGEVVNLNAVRNAGYQFGHWSGDAGGTSPSTMVTMNSDKSVTANFSKEPDQVVTKRNVTAWGSGVVLTRELKAGDTVNGSVTIEGSSFICVSNLWGYKVLGPGGRPLHDWEGRVNNVELNFTADSAGSYSIKIYHADACGYWDFTIRVWPPNWQ